MKAVFIGALEKLYAGQLRDTAKPPGAVTGFADVPPHPPLPNTQREVVPTGRLDRKKHTALPSKVGRQTDSQKPSNKS
jgi:hypothetical protein